MMKRIFSALIFFVLAFSFCCSFAELNEEELYIEDWVIGEDEDDNKVIADTDGSTTITITCTGDLTIGGEKKKKKRKKFYDELDKHDGSISFTMANVRDIFRKDDLTLVNFEGTFTNSKNVPDNKKGNDFLFNISPEYVTVLTENYIEAVSLENNHVYDHGDEGYEETIQTLRDNGIIYSIHQTDVSDRYRFFSLGNRKILSADRKPDQNGPSCRGQRSRSCDRASLSQDQSD